MNDVIILCGGKGTRIKKISQDKPKSLMSLGNNKFFLDLLITKLINQNVRNRIRDCKKT